MKRLLATITILLVAWAGFSQVKIRSYLSDDTVRFAQPTTLNIDISVPQDIPVLMPQLPDTLAKDLEISSVKIDTASHGKGVVYKYRITFFAFDDTVFHLPAIPIRIGQKLYFSDSTLRLVVLPIERDSAQLARIDTSQVIDVFDLKPPINPPLTLRELWLRYRYWLLGLLLLGLLAYLIYLIYRKIKQRRQFKQLPIEEQIEPHELALRRLRELEEKKLYHKGNFKEFYSLLSEILREYIERRFYIRALESTTSELRILLEATDQIPDELKSGLIDLFEVADLAKFAYYKPLPDVCDKHLEFAYAFVEKTKPQPQQSEEQQQDTDETINKEIVEQ